VCQFPEKGLPKVRVSCLIGVIGCENTIKGHLEESREDLCISLRSASSRRIVAGKSGDSFHLPIFEFSQGWPQ